MICSVKTIGSRRTFFFTYLLRFGIKPIYNVITKEETQQPTNKRIIGGYQVTPVRKLVSNFERGIEQHIILKFLVLFILVVFLNTNFINLCFPPPENPYNL